jgi:MerR family transcriptional regulator, light-induced transcriptional regulator
MSNINQDMSIAVLERETGISQDVLRKWEARYGFPVPWRDAKGMRFYPSEQVARIKTIKRLLDCGLRPAKLLVLDNLELAKIADAAGNTQTAGDPAVEKIVDLLRRHDIAGVREALERELALRGLEVFVLALVAPLNHAVGAAWYRGELPVYAEHLYTAAVRDVLGKAIAGLPTVRQGPRVLLTTPPGELHVLGILMVRAVFALHGADCVDLGSQTPLLELIAASEAYSPDIVALSFSSAYPQRRIGPFLKELRHAIPVGVEIWIGGEGTRRATGLPAGIRCFLALPPAIAALRETPVTPAF